MIVRTPTKRLVLLAGIAALLGVAGGGAAWVLVHLIELLTTVALFHELTTEGRSLAELDPGLPLFDRTVERLGLKKVRLHDLRHTYATLALRAGVDPKTVSARLGHATVAFTLDVYTKAVPQLDREAADKIADLIFGEEEG